MNDKQVETMIREYIPQTIHMALATSKDNKPWVCQVHFAYDDELNLYFVSSRETRHAQELIANSFVSGSISIQHEKNQKVRCVDFEGTAEVLHGVDGNNLGLKAYVERFESKDGSLLAEISKDGNTALFKINVSDYYVFDAHGETRGKFTLPWHDEVKA